MNLDRHMKAHKDMFYHLVRGDGNSAEKHRDFYDEYLAVMDLTAEFYLQTIDQVFVHHMFAKGEMLHRGRRIDLYGDQARFADDGRGREGRYHRRRPVRSRSQPVQRHPDSTRRHITSARASAITAFSMARASGPTSRRGLPTSCGIRIHTSCTSWSRSRRRVAYGLVRYRRTSVASIRRRLHSRRNTWPGQRQAFVESRRKRSPRSSSTQQAATGAQSPGQLATETSAASWMRMWSAARQHVPRQPAAHDCHR